MKYFAYAVRLALVLSLLAYFFVPVTVMMMLGQLALFVLVLGTLDEDTLDKLQYPPGSPQYEIRLLRESLKERR